MKSLPLTHRLAVIAMIAVTVLNVGSSIIVGPRETGTQIFELALGTAIWSFLTYKVWKRPRKWGLGVGILLFAALVFQIYLFIGASSSGFSQTMGILGHPIVFALWEIPLLVAAVCCIRLREVYAKSDE